MTIVEWRPARTSAATISRMKSARSGGDSVWGSRAFCTRQDYDPSCSRGSGTHQRDGYPLSEREREVLEASVEAATIPAIAALLSLSEATVRNHLSAAIQKLGARNRGEAARLAIDKGWIGPSASD